MPALLKSLLPARKALSIAVKYSHLAKDDPSLVLEDSHNDPRTITKLLIDIYGYKEEDITVLMDDESGQYQWPTRDNILNAMRNLVAEAHAGDHFVFHFSGHGSQIVNTNGTEEDGFDEVIWPVDVEYDEDPSKIRNYIIDDDIHDILVNPLPAGAHLEIIFDACHSGSAADLPYCNGDFCPPTPCSPLQTTRVQSLRIRGKQGDSTTDALAVEHDLQTGVMEEKPLKRSGSKLDKVARRKSISSSPALPDVVSWAACMDDQVTLERRGGGLFVTAFANAIRRNPHQEHGDLLRSVTRELARITAMVNAHRPANWDVYCTAKPQLGSLHEMNEVLDAPLDL